MIQQRDMPRDLSEAERIAYRKAWDRAALKFAKENGLPRERVTAQVDLHAASTAYFEEREPIAHKAGMAALTRYRKLCGIAVPKVTARRARTTCPHCGGALDAVAS